MFLNWNNHNQNDVVLAADVFFVVAVSLKAAQELLVVHSAQANVER